MKTKISTEQGKLYIGTITDTYSGTVLVRADSDDEAYEKLEQYNNEGCINVDDYIDNDIDIISVEESGESLDALQGLLVI